MSTLYQVSPEEWLQAAIADYEHNANSVVRAPLNHKGEPYTTDGLFEEQQRAIYPIVLKVREWMTCDDLSAFQTGFFTIYGKGGTGKSTILNTLTSVFRTLFQYNDVVVTAAPTGTAAFNVAGETLHRFNAQGIRGEYMPYSLGGKAKQRLLDRCKHLLCLIIDERSLLSSKLLGTTAQIVSETIFNGSKSNELFGKIPVVVLAGDDYQLPGREEGGIQALSKTGSSKMTQKGRTVFCRCAEKVLQLQTNQRISDSQVQQKEMCERIRLGVNVLDEDVQKLQSLHLDTMRVKHGDDVVNQIEKEAVYLFWTNEKRVQHNLIRLGETNTDDNPTVIVKPISQGKKHGIGINAHFDDETPPACLLCVDAKVSVQGCNFQPIWGIYNGSSGTVNEIVFDEGKDPNKGDHPKYVVVNFPQYVGPAWDIENPKVNIVHYIHSFAVY